MLAQLASRRAMEMLVLVETALVEEGLVETVLVETVLLVRRRASRPSGLHRHGFPRPVADFRQSNV